MSDSRSDSVDKPAEPQDSPQQASDTTATEQATPNPGDRDGEDASSSPRKRRRRRRGGRGRGERRASGDAPSVEREAGDGGGAGSDEPLAADEVYAERASPPERALRGEPEREPEPEHDEAADRGEEPEPRDGVDLGEARERATAAAIRDDGAPADIDPAALDSDGIKILNRLHRFGHQAYFVGGCVRDALVGRKPKDFDIATSAHPGEVRSLFRNCRLIGRRFRLAHIYFRGGKIIEVATFRANPIEAEQGEDLPEDLLITRDNVFGTAEEDARRRDFTVNGLFYDIRLGRVIDYVDGRRDVETKLMRTIGNPEIRMREDPVRVLRAVRFAARLGFDIDPQTYAAMEGAVEDLPRCAPARLLEEVFKLLRGGSSKQSFELLHALGALKLLMPPVGEYLETATVEGQRELFARLGALDARVTTGPVDDSVIMAVLLTPVARTQRDPERTDARIDALLEQMVQTARLPRRIADRARQLLWAEGVLSGEKKRRKSLASFRHHPLFPDALALLEIAAEATGTGRELVERWRGDKPLVEPPRERESAPGEAGKGRRRRRRRGRRREGNGAAEETPQ